MGEVLVLMEEIEKTFPGVHALNQCKFELRAGEVHALMGENGAGKSTLMKILTGEYRKDSGRIIYKGREVDIENPKAAQELGISIIHQELNLMPHLTIAQNIFIGRESKKGSKFIVDENFINEETKKLFKMMNLDLNPRTKVSKLPVCQQQMVEIARAVSFNSEVLIMDEPTAALTESEIEELFKIINMFKEKGVGIIYISHRMEEIKKISDRVTVMRDGCYVDTVNSKDVTIDHIIHLMVGRTIFESAKIKRDINNKEVVLEVKNLNRGRMVKDVSFNLRKGEILGFAGLMGAGRTEVARAIFGADKLDSGEIYVSGVKVTINSPSDAVEHGIGYLSEDRKQYGVTLGMDVESNIVLSSFKDFLGPLGWIKTSKTSKIAQEMVDRLKVKTPSIKQKVKNLSGGNQQKVVIGKWLTRNSNILIFDEPTRGIDVGAKNEIYKLLNDLVEQGNAIIMISSELTEIIRMSHRVVVMCEGRITGVVSAEDATQKLIMQYATKR